MQKAQKALGFKGFHAVKKVTALYKKALKIYETQEINQGQRWQNWLTYLEGTPPWLHKEAKEIYGQ